MPVVLVVLDGIYYFVSIEDSDAISDYMSMNSDVYYCINMHDAIRKHMVLLLGFI